MSYTPTEWKTGDVVTSAKLNKLEQGVAAGSGVLVVHESYDSATSTWTMDTVASEIWSAMQTGLAIVVSDISSSVIAYVEHIPEESEEYYFVICDNAGPQGYSAANGDDYPSREVS